MGRTLQAEGTVFARSVLPEQRFKTPEGRGEAKAGNMKPLQEGP